MSPRTDCPGNERLAEAWGGGPDPAADRVVLDHAGACPACGRKLDVLAALELDILENMGDLPESLSPRNRRRLRTLARRMASAQPGFGSSVPRAGHAGFRPAFAAAAAVLLVATLGGLSVSRWLGANRFRGSAEIRLVRPGGALDRAPSIFQWTGVPETDGYAFSLHDDELRRIYESGTTATRLLLPEEARRRLIPRRSYVWTVEARHDDGRVLDRKSRTFTFIARRP